MLGMMSMVGDGWAWWAQMRVAGMKVVRMDEYGGDEEGGGDKEGGGDNEGSGDGRV